MKKMDLFDFTRFLCLDFFKNFGPLSFTYLSLPILILLLREKNYFEGEEIKGKGGLIWSCGEGNDAKYVNIT